MVKWSLPAKRNLKAIYDYISKDSRFYAKRVIEEIVEKSETLDKFPRMGRVVPEIGNENIRELIV